jgi:DNA-directed RNA polymerase alpha subunit
MTQHRLFSQEEARRIGDAIGINWDEYDIDEFRAGLSIELEHGSHDPETDVIGDDVNKAGKIAWAHLKELPDYYTRLKKMEEEGEAYWESKKASS